MTRESFRVAALLFGSGLCALIYQTVWLRQFRLIFGASTFATGAVLAIFMAGLGLGSALLGKRADTKEQPLRYYGQLELLIALATVVSQPLLWLAAKIYFATGGSPALGIGGATVVRLLLAIVVLGPATLLMGGTLPAAARAVSGSDDDGRRAVALLYGVNTLGAVAGALLSTFVLLEALGNRSTLAVAVILNVLVALTALRLRVPAIAAEPPLVPAEETLETETVEPELPPASKMPVYAASAIVGFAFLLMELVWYRMLSPLLGGTTYMFGLILATVLLGIGAGGTAYALVRRRPPTVAAFALTCTLEALAIALPFALGDRLAILANALRVIGATGFGGHVFSWTVMTMIVVFPAAFIAGIQFPMLIALLGRGRENVGREIGAAYAWNSAGAIAGSLAGGFGLLPLLSAPGCWRLVAFLLVALGCVAMVRSMREQRSVALTAVLVAVIAVTCATAVGPTAVWRHSGIGAARAPRPATQNELLDWIHTLRRSILWEADGRESSVALAATGDLSFIVNGKADGSARGDAGTQVMAGMIAGTLQPNPRRALVVGLGTGSTAGWLGAIPSMERVDVVELEPLVLDVARACAAVNADAMRNPKLRISIGDAREVLLTTRDRYDIIASEPSNPYRAGIASLFTTEFYEEAAARMNRGGIFVQWLQTYGVHADTVRTVYATLTSVFPNVQTWRTTAGDVVLLASKEPLAVDAAVLRARLATEPFHSAARNAWRAVTPAHFLQHHIANEDFARAAAGAGRNTDDRTIIEFGFARSIDATENVLDELGAVAAGRNMQQPKHLRGDVGPADPPPVHHLEEQVMQAEAAIEEQRLDEAVALLENTLLAYRRDPWPSSEVMQRGVNVAIRAGSSSPERARRLHAALSEPFAATQQEDWRHYGLLLLANRFEGCGPQTLTALAKVEPNPYWQQRVLDIRARCYARAGLTDLAAEARRELELYESTVAARLID